MPTAIGAWPGVVEVKVQVLYWIDPESPKANDWNDGFVAAVEALRGFDTHPMWTNLFQASPRATRHLIKSADADFIIVKSNWRWHVDRLFREAAGRWTPPAGLMISGAVKPPRLRTQRRYRTLWFQTYWYADSYLGRHPNALHAYGANTVLLHEPTEPVEKDIDLLYVGAVAEHKRLERLASRAGRRVVVTEIAAAQPKILEALVDSGVEIHDFVGMGDLKHWYWRAESVFVPATTAGGGERPVMEALACGADVEVEEDNPKLMEVAQLGRHWTTQYYTGQLLRGIQSGVAAARASR